MKKLWNIEELSSRKVEIEVTPTPNIYSSVTGIMMTGEVYKGKSTRVFAYYGLPDNAVKSPAVILVHGGAGFAEHEWVKMWTKRGYVALAIDNNCHMYPSTNAFMTDNVEAGAVGYGSFDQMDGDIEDTWVYQSVSNISLGVNFLSGLQQVDSENIGIAGISWGGYLTMLALANDKRLKWGSVSYTGGYLYEDKFCIGYGLTEAKMGKACYDKWIKNFDPTCFSSEISQPTLFIRGADDVAFDFLLWHKFVKSLKCPLTFTLLPHLAHDQMQGSCQKEIFDFADKISAGDKLPFLDKTVVGERLTAQICGEFVKAQLVFTTTIAHSGYDLIWEQKDAILDKSYVSASPPADFTGAYFNLIDKKGDIFSSLPIFTTAICK